MAPSRSVGNKLPPPLCWKQTCVALEFPASIAPRSYAHGSAPWKKAPKRKMLYEAKYAPCVAPVNETGQTVIFG
ncbi:MAG: hypothetical protein DMD63_04210 [Gemmatimonadetes bacterium]|nr:MAG: hypothetical protein DMD63_04210 [Gemmatimonadota bacterium]